jgi:hypothetical protein
LSELCLCGRPIGGNDDGGHQGDDRPSHSVLHGAPPVLTGSNAQAREIELSLFLRAKEEPLQLRAAPGTYGARSLGPSAVDRPVLPGY